MKQFILTILIFLMPFWQSKSPEEKFWQWFKNNEAMLFSFESDQEVIFNKLATELHKINSNLVFEFGPIKNGQREFIISAGGIKSAFPTVQKLVHAAPRLHRWEIIAFRPRRIPLNSVEIDGISVHPDDVLFTLELDSNKIGITLFFDDKVIANETLCAHFGYLLLDQAIGEYDVETFVGFIDFKSKSINSPIGKQSLSLLASEFDKFLKTITN